MRNKKGEKMSRELNFRAWDGKHISPVISLYLDADTDEEFVEVSCTCGCGNPFEYSKSEVVVMQCTGLKDSNGKDVYEGDIVLVTPHAGMDKSSYYGVFEFVPGGFQLKAPKERFPFGGGYVPYLQSMGLLCGIEVVGNIYENPEFLKEI
jgi:hypothetical protein